MKIILVGFIFHNYQKKKAAITIDDDQLIFNKPSIYSKPFAILKKGRLCKIHKCKDEWCKISVEKYKGWVKKRYFVGSIINYFLYLAVQILSRTKYQTALAIGSTIASVKAIINETLDINIKTVMAIKKCPIVYIIVLNIDPFVALINIFYSKKRFLY